MVERDYRFTPLRKEQIHKTLMIDKLLPKLPYAISKVSYLDGCKVYFQNGGWIIARFSEQNLYCAYSVRWKVSWLPWNWWTSLRSFWN